MSQRTAHQIYSGFPLAHDTYNALSVGSDGKVYYVLSSEDIEIGGHVYVFDPKERSTQLIGDLTELCGEKGNKTIGQGKSHVEFHEMDGRLYYATHVGIYELIDGMDRIQENPPDGYGLYPGGHILSYDMDSGKTEDLVTVPHGEGMVSMTMDTVRGHIYGLTWPTGYFIHYDVGKDQLTDLGAVARKGEAGTPGRDFRVLCRSLVVNPGSGTVYFSSAEGDVLYYNPARDGIHTMENVNLRLDYFGSYDPSRPGSMAYHWRKAFWYEKENVLIGVHGNSGYLFQFSPEEDTIELFDRITSDPSRKSGMSDQFSYGYLGFTLGPDGETVYYLTGGPVYENGKRVEGVKDIAKGAAKGLENLHLVTYHLPSNKYTDHGPIFYEDGSRPTYVNSIAVDNENVYFLGRMKIDGHEIQDLAWVKDPIQNGSAKSD